MLQVEGRCPGNRDQDGDLMGMGEALSYILGKVKRTNKTGQKDLSNSFSRPGAMKLKRSHEIISTPLNNE